MRTKKAWLTRLGRVEVERSHYFCRSCGNGFFPLDRALGLEGDTLTPGMLSVMAETTPMMSFDAASRLIANLGGVNASSSSLQRWSLAPGEEVLRVEKGYGSAKTRKTSWRSSTLPRRRREAGIPPISPCALSVRRCAAVCTASKNSS